MDVLFYHLPDKLGFYYNAETRILTVRKPAFNVGTDWSMQLSAVH